MSPILRRFLPLSMVCNIPIKGFIETSFIDWKGRLSSVVFTGGCNFRCPFCHNRDLVLNHDKMENIPLDYILLTLRKYRKWIDHVVITGGEPTIHGSLFQLTGTLKMEGFRIKLDTNGSSPATIKGLVNENLIDYIAMDVKGPISHYKRWCGIDVETAKIEESIQFILSGKIDYEFRMTVVPFFHRVEDVYEVADYVKDAKRFYIQEFRPKSTLNPRFTEIKPFSPQKMEEIRKNVNQILEDKSQKTEDRRNPRSTMHDTR